MSTLQTAQLERFDAMIDFGIGQPTVALLPLEPLRAAADDRLSKDSARLLQYGPNQGDMKFRDTLADFLSRHYEAPVSAEHLMITAGASQGLDLICTRFTTAGDTIFVEEPTYFLALLIFRDHGLNVVGIPIDEHGLRIDALEDALTRHRPQFIYTIPTFQNPSATTLSGERRERLRALSDKHGFLIVADEVYHLLDFGSTPPPPFAAYSEGGRVLSLGSFSKISAPGLRLGWIQSGPEHLDTLTNAGLVESGGGLNPFTSGIMQSMIELGFQDNCLKFFQDLYRERSAVLSNALHEFIPAASFHEPVGGFFIWLQLPDERVASEILPYATRAGVNFQPGTRFGTSPALNSFVRLSFAHYEAERLVKGVKRLASVVT